MVLTDNKFSCLLGVSESTSIAPESADLAGLGVSEIDTARTVSATASSSADGSKMMLSPTEMTRSVMGGFDDGILPAERGYKYGAASQSSLKRGSSSFSDFRAGRRVESRARCVVRLRRGSG